MSSLLNLTRASATGNTFIIVEKGPMNDRSQLVEFLCHGFVGFHSDGVIFIDRFEKRDGENALAKWDFYNADGSHAEMCGNGTRALAMHFYKKEKIKKLQIQTVVGDITATVESDHVVKTQMPPIQDFEKKSIVINDDKISGVFINSGVPHFVIPMMPDGELAELLRKHKDFGKQGTNVTFIEDLSPGEVRAVSFERGVEDFTLSCGTGAVAAAITHLNENQDLKICSVEMPGGTLQVAWNSNEEIFLSGPAQTEFTFQVHL